MNKVCKNFIPELIANALSCSKKVYLPFVWQKEILQQKKKQNKCIHSPHSFPSYRNDSWKIGFWMYCKSDVVIDIHLTQKKHMDFTFSKCNQFEFRSSLRLLWNMPTPVKNLKDSSVLSNVQLFCKVRKDSALVS